jgi:hypothetical protein
MANHLQFLRVKKLTGQGIIRSAARHNLREIQSELGAGSHIDPTLTRMNSVLAGATVADDVSSYAKGLMVEAGLVKLRKDAVRGLEIIISLQPSSSVDQSAFFADALAWVKDFFRVPVLSAVVHNDEAAPHCHILLLPLLHGRMQGSDLAGNRTRLQAMQTGFYSQVGQKYGLTRPKPPQRLNSAIRAKSASLVLSALQANPDLMDKAQIENALLAVFARDPEPLLSALGLSLPNPVKGNKSFVEIMTKPCPEKPIGFARHPIPIGFTRRKSEINRTLCSVGFRSPSPSVQATDSVQTGYERIPDEALPVEHWDTESGEFIRQPEQRQRQVVL